jgi:hypothetical protein
MRLNHRTGAACGVLLAVIGASFAAMPLRGASAQEPNAPAAARSGNPGTADIAAVDGDWIFVEDRTPGRTLEQINPPMSSSFSMRVEEGAVVLNGHGSGHRDVRVALDGAVAEREDAGKVASYRGGWKDGAFEYEVSFERVDGTAGSGISLIRRTFRPTADGLLVTVAIDPPSGSESTGLYRHPADIAMPVPAKATIGDVGWIAGAWTGTRSSGSSVEERWTPPLGGAMLAVSRTVNSKGRMAGFEYLRIVERDGGLVYVAQPGGKAATEFVLSELTASRAVFDNPRHDYPKRITYELSADGTLTATTGFMKGGTPRRFEFRRAVP